MEQIGDAEAVEVSLFRDVIAGVKGGPLVFSQHSQHFLRAKGVVGALAAVAVGILGADKGAGGQGHLFEEIAGGLRGHLAVKRPSRDSVGLAVGQHQQGVVVEHFFKVGDAKGPVGGIPAESAADVVVDAPAVKLLQSFFRHGQGGGVRLFLSIGEQKEKTVPHGKFGGGAEAAVCLIIGSFPLGHALLQKGPGGRTLLRRSLGKQLKKLPPRGGEGLPVLSPGVPDGRQELPQSGQAAPAGGRKIGSGKEGKLFRGEKQGGGPAAAAGEGLAGRHVEAVNVRPLLPVHLDGDKALVEKPGNLQVLEALPGHDVAPMAGAVPDAEKDGFVLNFCLLQSFPSPGVPVHWIVRVLQEIGAGLAPQMVAHRDTSMVRYG